MSSTDEQKITKKIRAFLALKTPLEWDKEMGALQNRIKKKLRSRAFRWTRPEQLHVTLRFFGYVFPEDIVAIIERLQDAVVAKHQPFTLRCEGLGCFPNARRPRVLWAGLEGDLAALGSLQVSAVEATRTFGEPPEDRPFKAHLTLARMQEAERAETDLLQRVLEDRFAIESLWTVSELILMQSQLSPSGARYEPLASWQLGPRA